MNASQLRNSLEARERCRFQVIQKDLMDMLVKELKEELEAHDQLKTGNKAWLRRRLHGAIVRAHLAEREP